MKYEDLKKDQYDMATISKVIHDNFDEVLKDIALNKQWKVAEEIGIQPAYLSVLITAFKSIKGM